MPQLDRCPVPVPGRGRGARGAVPAMTAWAFDNFSAAWMREIMLWTMGTARLLPGRDKARHCSRGLTRPIRLILVFVLVRRRRMHMRPCRPLPPGQLAYLARELFARHTGVRWPESPVIPGWGDHP